MKAVVIGTRGSPLALAQTDLLVAKLRRFSPDVQCQIEIIQTEGDRLSQASLPAIGGKGVFIKEIEQALLQREIDLAVHSLKDMPTEQPVGLIIGVVLEREDPRDVLISHSGLSLEGLPKGARVGTGSPRRSAQLLALRSDLRVMDLRGNVETRLRKLDEGQYDAIILAAAGLARLELESRITEYLSPSVMLPAVGQGALAVELRDGDRAMSQLVQPLDHKLTRIAVDAERAFLQALGGGCRTPITAYGSIQDGKLVLDGMVARMDGTKLIRASLTGQVSQPEELGRQLAERLVQQGADELIPEIHHGASI